MTRAPLIHSIGTDVVIDHGNSLLFLAFHVVVVIFFVVIFFVVIFFVVIFFVVIFIVVIFFVVILFVVVFVAVLLPGELIVILGVVELERLCTLRRTWLASVYVECSLHVTDLGAFRVIQTRFRYSFRFGFRRPLQGAPFGHHTFLATFYRLTCKSICAVFHLKNLPKTAPPGVYSTVLLQGIYIFSLWQN